MGKVIKFVFKFLNHDLKKCTVIKVCVHSDKVVEWEYKEDEFGNYLKWLVHCERWEHTLKQKIKQEILSRNFEGEPGKELFGSYRLIKKKTLKWCEAVNMNPAGMTVVGNENVGIKFREIKSLRKCVIKFAKGAMPDPWTEMFKYVKKTYHLNYLLSGHEISQTIDLSQFSEFEVPEETTAHNVTSQVNAMADVSTGESTRSTINRRFNAEKSSNIQSINQNTQSTNQTHATTRNPSIPPRLNQSAAPSRLSSSAVRGGGDNYQDKYTKYKKKYVDLKTKM